MPSLPHQLHSARQKTAFGTSPSLCAFPTHASQWLFGDWGVRAGARESPGRPLGWQPPGPGAVPGVVATPPLPRRRQSQPAAPRLRHSRRKERKAREEEEEEKDDKEGRKERRMDRG